MRFVCRNNGLLGHEPDRTATTADALEEPDGLRLSAEEHFAPRGVLQRSSHEGAADTPSLILRVEEDLWC
jgi:hypothetical protein